MILFRGFSLLVLLLFAWRSHANPSCIYIENMDASRRTEVTTASDCMYFTILVTDSVMGRKIAARMRSGSLGDRGLCEVFSGSTNDEQFYLGQFSVEGRNDGIISQRNSDSTTSMYLTCFQDVPEVVMFSFYSVDSVPERETINNAQLQQLIVVHPYQPITLYRWRIINYADDALVSLGLAFDAVHDDDLVLVFSYDEENPLIGVFGGPDGALYNGITLEVQLLASDSVTSSNSMIIIPDLQCLSDRSHFLTDWIMHYDPGCPSQQLLVTLDAPVSYLISFPPLNNFGIKCDIYQGNTTDNLLGTLESDPYSVTVVNGTSADIFLHCSTPLPFVGSFRISLDEYITPCGGDITLNKTTSLTLDIPTTVDGFLATPYCEWHIQSPFFLNAAQLISPRLTVFGDSFLQVTNRYMIPTSLLNNRFSIHYQTTLLSETATTVRFYADKAVTTLTPFDINVAASCSIFCLGGTASNEHEILLGWTSHESVQLVTLQSEPTSTLWYSRGTDDCLAELPINTWQTVTVTAIGGLTDGMFEERIPTRPGKMNTPFLISTTATTAKIGWVQYTEGDVLINTYYVNWNMQTATSTGLSAEIEGLAPNSPQSVTVQAVNTGGAGRESEELQFTTEPTALLNIEAISCLNTTSIVVGYTQVINDGLARSLVHAEICWCYSLDDIKTDNLASPTHTLTGLIPGRRVVVFTKVYYDDGFVATGPHTVLQPVAPAPSTATTLIAVDRTEVSFTWEPYNEPGDIVPDEYVIYWKDLLDSDQVTVSARTTNFIYTVDNLSPNTNYYIHIAVKTGNCVSAFSPAMLFATLPGPATNVVQGSADTTNMDIFWVPPSGGSARSITNYTVHWTGAEQGNVTVPSISAALSGLTANTLYIVTVATLFDDGYISLSEPIRTGTKPVAPHSLVISSTKTSITVSYTKDASGNLPVTFSYTDGAGIANTTEELYFQLSNLLPNTFITFSIVAQNEFAVSEIVSSVAITLPPDPVIVFTDEVFGDAFVDWMFPPNGGFRAVDFEVTYDKINTPMGSQSMSTASFSTTITSLESNTYYWIQIVANFENGFTTFSENYTLLTRPANVPAPMFAGVTQTSLTLQWSAPSGDGHLLYSLYVQGSPALINTNQLQGTVTGLSPNTIFDNIYVIATNNAGEESSSSVMFPTLPGPPSASVDGESSDQMRLILSPPDGDAYSPINYRITYDGQTITQTATSYLAENLIPGTRYTFTVVAEFPGPPETSAIATGCTLTGPPPNLHQTGATASSITFQWQDPQTCSPILGFNINSITTTLNNPFTLNNLDPNTFYDIRVAGTIETGVGVFATLQMATVPGLPMIRAVEISSTQAKLNMQLIGGLTGAYTFQHYLINGGGHSGTQVSADEFVLTGLTPTSVYNIEVEAIYDGLTVERKKTVEFHTDPSPPRNLDYLIINSTAVKITWEKPEGGNDIDHYILTWGVGTMVSVSNDFLDQIITILPNDLIFIGITTVNFEQTPSGTESIQIATDALPTTAFETRICTTDFVVVSWIDPFENQAMYRMSIYGFVICEELDPCVETTSNTYNFTMLPATDLMVNLTTIYNLGFGETEMFRASSVVVISTKPDVPFNILVTEEANNTLAVVQWFAPIGGDGIIGYVVQYNTDTTNSTVEVDDPSALETTIGDLKTNTLYFVSVAAVTGCGQGDFSSVFSYATEPTAVTEITQTMPMTTSTLITITTPTEDGTLRTFVSYEVFVDGVSQGIFTSSNVNIAGLDSNTEYEVTVTSQYVDSSGVFPDSYLSSGIFFIQTIPSSPVALSLGSPSTSSFSASWSKPPGGDAITSYDFEYDTDIAFSAPITANTTSLSISVSFLESNTAYYCRVIAKNQQGSSAPGPIDTIDTDPLGPVVVFLSSTSDSITVDISVDVGGRAKTLNGYDVEAEDTSMMYPSASGIVSPITITGLPSATRFDVKAFAVFGSTRIQSATDVMYTVSNSVDTPSVTSTKNSIAITWIAPTNNGTEVDGYEVRINDASIGPYEDVGDVLATTVPGLESNTHYTVGVFAYNTGGRSSDGGHAEVWTDPFDPIISWDTSTVDSIAVSYTWDDNNGFEGYYAVSHSASTHTGQTSGDVHFSTNPIVIPGLMAGTWYTIQQSLLVRNEDGNLTLMSNSQNAVTVPDPPQNLMVTSESETSVDLSWDPPNSGVVNSYLVVFTATTVVDVGVPSKMVQRGSTSITVTGLASNTIFEVSVQSQNSGGASTPVTETATTSPVASGPPTTVVAYADSLEIAWTPPPNYARNASFSVAVFDAFGSFQLVQDNVTSPTLISPLSSSTVYHMFIVSDFGDHLRTSPTTRHLTVPGPMHPLMLVSVSTDTIVVNHYPLGGGFPCCELLQYELLVKTSTNNLTMVNDPSTTEFSFSVSPNSQYRMFLRARNEAGPGEFSPELDVWSKPSPVGAPRMTVSTSDSISLEWDPLVEGDFMISDYFVSISPFTSGDGRLSVLNSTNATFTNLEPNRRYTFTVQAEGVVDLSDPLSETSMYTAPNMPQAPVSSTVSPPTASGITIEWSCAGLIGCLAITEYEIVWDQVGGSQNDSGSEILNINPTICEHSYHISGLLINTLYSIRVSASNGYSFGPFSAEVQICTNPAVPDQPTVRFHHRQQGIIVDWNPPTMGGGVPITMYKIIWSSGSDSGHKLVTVSNSNHTAVITGLLPVTTYQVAVQAINAHGISSASTTSMVTTGSGIICNEKPTIKLTAEDVARMDSVSGDQIVVSSREIIHQPAANKLMSQCKIPAVSGSGALFHFNLSDCEPLVAYADDKFNGIDNNTLLFTYTVQLARFAVLSSIVQRFDPTTTFEFQCVFNRSSSITSDYVHPYIFKDLVIMDPEHGQFDLSLNFFTSDGYNTPLAGSPPTVEVFSFVFAQLSLGENSNNIILQAEHCWATPSNSPDDSVSYPIVVNGCPADNAFDESGTILVTRNYQPNIAQFQFKAFVWANIPDRDQMIFVHCNTMVCDPRNRDGCTTLNCGSERKRRDVPNGVKSQRVTYGPIMLSYKVEDLCAEANGGCEDLCMVENQSVKCMCKSGRKLNDDGRTCSVKYYRTEESRMIPQSILLVLVAGLLLTVVGLSLHKNKL